MNKNKMSMMKWFCKDDEDDDNIDLDYGDGVYYLRW